MSMYDPPPGGQPGVPGQQPYNPYSQQQPPPNATQAFPTQPVPPYGAGAPVPGPYGWEAAHQQQWAPPPPRKNKTGLIIGVAVAGALLCCAGGTGVFFLARSIGQATPEPTRLARTPTPALPTRTAAPADPMLALRTIQPGRCLRNTGTSTDPVISIAACAPGTYEVLKNVPGTADGSVCQGVPGYTSNYTNQNSLDDALSFTLCLRKR